MPTRSENPRARRVADRIHVELAEILITETEDPRLRLLSIMAAKVSRDLASARIFIAGPVPKADEPAVLRALRHATPYFRSLLAPRLKLRVVPEIHFEFDRSAETGDRIEQLLRQIREKPNE